MSAKEEPTSCVWRNGPGLIIHDPEKGELTFYRCFTSGSWPLGSWTRFENPRNAEELWISDCIDVHNCREAAQELNPNCIGYLYLREDPTHKGEQE